MEEEQLDLVLVPAGLLVFGIYHGWLHFTLNRCPQRTVIGLNAESRRQWVLILMDPLKNGVLAVQTIRNNILASTYSPCNNSDHTQLSHRRIHKQLIKQSQNPPHLWQQELHDLFNQVLLCPCLLSCGVPFERAVHQVRQLLSHLARFRDGEKKERSHGIRRNELKPSYLMCFVLYFLDTTTSFTRRLHCQLFTEHKTVDLEAND